jgi:carbon monoxide dehydrogenase subunit G
MAKVERTITINAPIEKVFAYVTDPTNELEFVPGITDVRNVKGEGLGQTADWTYKMLGIPLSGKSEVLEYKPNERYVTKSSGGVVSTWTWTFKSEGGSTQVNVVVDYTIPISVLGKVGERLVLRQTERETNLSMATLKDRLEG